MRYFFLIALIASSWAQNVSSIQTERVNELCQAGYYWTGQSCMACKSVNGKYCLCSSQDSCDSVICDSGENVGTTERPICISSCGQGCTDCQLTTTAQVCQECASGYQLIGAICVPLNSCEEYDSQTALCTKCKSGYFFNYNFDGDGANMCTPCSASYCMECDSQNTCNTCYTGFYWDGLNASPACKACGVTNCLACTSSTDCSQCNTGYFLSTANEKTTCTACEANCSQCSDAETCTECKSGYLLSEANCVQCPKSTMSNCIACSAVDTCSACKSGYILNQTDNTCVAMVTGCTVAGSSLLEGKAQCSECLDTFYLDSATSCKLCSTFPNYLRCSKQNADDTAPTVTQCANGYFMVAVSEGKTACIKYSTPNTCQKMQPNQNSSSVCESCLSGYIALSEGKCQMCSISKCLTCQANSDNSALECSQCFSGYYLNDSKTCVACLSNCKECADNKTCSSCYSGYQLVDNACKVCSMQNCLTCNDTSCEQCADGYFQDANADGNQLCYKCPADCKTCSAPGYACETCPFGSSLQQGFGCVKVQDFQCLLVGQKGCEVCEYGYYLSSGTCLKCVDQSSGVRFVCRGNDLIESGEEEGGSGNEPSPSKWGYLVSLGCLAAYAMLV